MFEIGVFHNGASGLPVILAKDAVAMNDGSLAEVHASAREFMPVIVREYGGKVELPECGYNYTP